MAKINPIFGKFQGKLGGTVFAIRNGEQVMREYNPAPFNPNTEGQIAARARLKLMSQLAVVASPAIAMPRVGAVTSRNQFVKSNYGLSSYSQGTASITLANVKLTNGVIGLPMVSVQRTNLRVSLALTAPITGFDRVVYFVLVKQADNELRVVGHRVATVPGVNGDYPAEIQIGTNDPIVTYAYAMRFNTETAKAKYGDITAQQAETIAKLVATRVLSENDVTLTETVGLETAAFSA